MATSSQREIFPVFDKADPKYQSFDDKSPSDFTEDSHYFLMQIDDEKFELRRRFYIDLVLAPAYILYKKLAKNSFDYSSTLTEVFFCLYPNADNYQMEIECGFEYMKEAITNIIEEEHDKGVVLSKLSSMQKRFEENIQFIKRIGANSDDYLQASKKVSQQNIEFIAEQYKIVSVKPSDTFSNRYFEKHPLQSWKRDPFAFFSHIVFEHKKELLKKFCDLQVSVAVHRASQAIESIKAKDEKQKLVDEFCAVLNVLYKEGNNLVRESCATIIHKLSERFKRINFAVEFDFSPESKVESKEFVKALFALKLTDEFCQEQRFIDEHKTKRTDYDALVSGDFARINCLQFNWPRQAVYYFLMKLMEHCENLRIADLNCLGKAQKILMPLEGFSEEKTPFKRGGYDTFKNHIAKPDKIKRNEAFDLIDSLFS